MMKVWLSLLKFGEFGEFTFFAKLSSSTTSYLVMASLDKICQTLCCQIDLFAVSPNFSHAKLSLFKGYDYVFSTSGDPVAI